MFIAELALNDPKIDFKPDVMIVVWLSVLPEYITVNTTDELFFFIFLRIVEKWQNIFLKWQIIFIILNFKYYFMEYFKNTLNPINFLNMQTK